MFDCPAMMKTLSGLAEAGVAAKLSDEAIRSARMRFIGRDKMIWLPRPTQVISMKHLLRQGCIKLPDREPSRLAAGDNGLGCWTFWRLFALVAAASRGRLAVRSRA